MPGTGGGWNTKRVEEETRYGQQPPSRTRQQTSYEYESSRKRTQQSSSGGSGGGSGGNTQTFGWKLLENGTYIRTYDSKTTAKEGANWKTTSASNKWGSGGSDNTNTIFNAAKGPGDYHGKNNLFCLYAYEIYYFGF